MFPRMVKRPLALLVVLMTMVTLLSACAGGVAQKDYDAVQAQLKAKEQELAQAKQQPASAPPSKIVQAGQLQPAAAGAQPTGWDTTESIRGGLKLLATYDSSGPDAWDPGAHPLVYMTSEGMGYGHRPSKTDKLPGVQVIDANTKQVIASALFDLGGDPQSQPHGLGISPDGKWVYIGFSDKVSATKETRNLVLIINARTLKIDSVLTHPVQRLHHIIGFQDWQGRDRVVLEMGFGANGGPHFIVDPKDNNKVVKAITYDDTKYQMGHPYITPDPSGKFLYVSLELSAFGSAVEQTGGIAKVNLETGAVTVIPGVGEHPIGTTSTADGKYTYVIDGEGSRVFKIDNSSNKVTGHTSAGVAGPYGIRLNWDETQIWTVGKGEGSHNTGGVLGVVDTKSFAPSREIDQPVDISGSVIDHAILHPDPKLNELWVSSAGTWETIVVDLNTRKVKAHIPSPNGGDTHSGGFVRYNRDWTGELMADHGGPKSTMLEIQRNMAKDAAAKSAAAATPAPAATPATTPNPVAAAASPTAAAPAGGAATGDLLAKGTPLYEKTAGGVGCASCHGLDAKGTTTVGAPDIRGKTEAQIRAALTGVPMMGAIKLTDQEIAAVAVYLESLNH